MAGERCGGDRRLVIGVRSSEYVGSCVCIRLLMVLMVFDWFSWVHSAPKRPEAVWLSWVRSAPKRPEAIWYGMVPHGMTGHSTQHSKRRRAAAAVVAAIAAAVPEGTVGILA